MLDVIYYLNIYIVITYYNKYLKNKQQLLVRNLKDWTNSSKKKIIIIIQKIYLEVRIFPI